MKIPFFTKWFGRQVNETCAQSQSRSDARPAKIMSVVPTEQPQRVPQIYWEDRWVDLGRLMNTIRTSTDVSFLVSLFDHYSGYVREAAISRCTAVTDATTLPALVGRLNDWVPEVRIAAQNTFKANLLDKHVPMLVSLLPQFSSLKNCGRDQHAKTLAELDEFLCLPSNIHVVLDGMHSSDIKVVRECFRLARRAEAMSPEELTRFAIHSKDLVIASTAMQLAENLDYAERLKIIQSGLRSPFGSVRAGALLGFFRSTSDPKIVIARSMLFDRQATVREIAWDWLAGQGEDIGAYYVPILSSSSQTSARIRCALWGVGKLKMRDSLPFVRQLIASSSPDICIAAILVAARLDTESVPQLLDIALRDTSNGTKKAVFALIRNYGARVSYEKLELLMNQANGIRLALQIARHADKWDWLSCIFQAAVHYQGSPESSILFGELRQWIALDAHNSASPSKHQINRLSEFARCGVLEKIERSSRSHIEFVMRCIGIPAG